MLFDTKLFHGIIQESHYDFQGSDYLYFEDKVEFYSLDYSKRKIQSFQELIYCMEVVLWLNPNLSWEKFIEMAVWVSDRTNGKTVRTYSEFRIEQACVRVFDQRRKPYVNNYRRIVFNPARRMSKDEKMSIVGKMCGGRKSRIDTQNIYDVVEEMMVNNIKIRLGDVAKSLGVSRQTISTHITPDIKGMIKDYNHALEV